ncbi:hypothetical protein ACRALDRAFT_2088703, partial [Sodiomyces alcalophilus JCM 7366]|uniref:uncharacterized protein n=1 Tax=Sodiomyces alcalophilus JCM 7366 TaxID=591952 RepID=UPI0039B4DC89
HQLNVMKEAYRLPMSAQTLKAAQREVFALECLDKEVPKLSSSRWDDGPFILSHLDLRWPNILVDDELNIVAIIDWEWTGSIPRRSFTPPSWLAGREPQCITGDEYRSEFIHFRNVLLAKGVECRQLAEDWDLELLNDVALPMAEVLRHHSHLNAIFYQAIYDKLFDEPSSNVVPRFFQ